MKPLLFIVPFFLLLASCQSPEQVSPPKEETTFKTLTHLMDQYADHTLQKNNINSIALAIYKDGEIYQNYYGSLDKNADNPPNDSTLYEIASISKVFVGSLAARAVVEGKITLQDDVRKHLTGNYSNLEFAGQPITIQHLLTHTLGLTNRTPPKLQEVEEKTKQGVYENAAFDYEMSDLLQELQSVTLDKKPGTFFEYNSTGPELVAYILEQVYQRPYKEILQLFLQELDMNNTYLQDYEQHKKWLANSYNSDEELATVFKNPLLGGAGGMISTLPDLAKFMEFQLESNDPLIKESVRTLFADDDDNTMGYLWSDLGTGEEEGFYYSKTGTSLGVQSGILICPDSDYGMILIINNDSEAAFTDWANLFFSKMEADLIKYPRLNLFALHQEDFANNPAKAMQDYQLIRRDTSNYFAEPSQLNSFGYELLNREQMLAAIEIFKFATTQFPTNSNLFDSLGEAYFHAKDYEQALVNYKKSFELNPSNTNAAAFIERINLMK